MLLKMFQSFRFQSFTIAQRLVAHRLSLCFRVSGYEIIRVSGVCLRFSLQALNFRFMKVVNKVC